MLTHKIILFFLPKANLVYYRKTLLVDPLCIHWNQFQTSMVFSFCWVIILLGLKEEHYNPYPLQILSPFPTCKASLTYIFFRKTQNLEYIRSVECIVNN